MKGFKQLESFLAASEIQHPIAQCLLTNDCILAFTECWKELIAKICLENKMPIIPETEIDSSIFELFAAYFHLNFDVHWKEKKNRFWK